MQSISFDIRSERNKFLSFSGEEKKGILLQILQPYIHEGENFQSIYDYLLESEGIIDEFLTEIYDVILHIIYDAQEGVTLMNNAQMQSISDKLNVMKECEQYENSLDKVNADTLLNY